MSYQTNPDENQILVEEILPKSGKVPFSLFPSKTNVKFWSASTTISLLVGYVGYYLCRNNLSAAFPFLGESFQLSNSQLGLIAFYSELSYTVGKFINGPLADRYGGKKFFLLGMVGTIFFNFLFSMARDLQAFIIIWCGCRFFLSMGWGGMACIVAKWYRPERYGRIMGILSLSFQFGGAIATLFTGFLIAQGAEWQDLFIYPALILSAMLILSFFLIKESPQAPLEITKATQHNNMNPVEKKDGLFQLAVLKILLRNRVFRSLLIFSFFVTFLRSAFLIWVPKILVDLGLENSQAVLQSTLFPLLGAISTILLGIYTDGQVKTRNRGFVMSYMLTGLVICLLCSSMVIVFFPLVIPYMAILIGLSGFFLLGPYSMASGCLSLDIGKEEYSGTCTGLVDGIGYLGGVLSLWMTGKGADLWGWDKVFLILAGFAAGSVLAAYLLGKDFLREQGNKG